MREVVELQWCPSAQAPLGPERDQKEIGMATVAMVQGTVRLFARMTHPEKDQRFGLDSALPIAESTGELFFVRLPAVSDRVMADPDPPSDVRLVWGLFAAGTEGVVAVHRRKLG